MRCAFAIVLSVALNSHVLADFFNTIDFPGAANTAAYGIDGGNIVGHVIVGSGDHGFLFDGVAFTKLDFPVGGGTKAFGIDGDVVVGSYDSGGATRGFAITPTPLKDADFDDDDDVDGDDFLLWQTGFPTASGAALAEGDADGDGDVDGADFVVWQTHFPFSARIARSADTTRTSGTEEKVIGK